MGKRFNAILVFFTLLLCGSFVWATTLYTVDQSADPGSITNYEMVDGHAADAQYWNKRWKSIDTRIGSLEGNNAYIFKSIEVSGEDTVSADSNSDTLTLVAGSNVTITNTASSDTIQFDVSTTPLDTLNDSVEVVAGTTDLNFDTNFSLSDAGSNQTDISLVDDPTIAGFLTVTEYIDIPEAAAPANPSANVGRFYVADDGGTTIPYFVDSAGTATNLLLGATDEAIQDLVGAMFSGNTETLGSLDYQDADGTIDLTVEDDLHLYTWTNVVDADITDTLTASIFKGSGTTTDAVDLGTAEVAGTLPATKIQDLFLRNNAADTTSGNLGLDDGVGDSPQLILTDATNETMILQKVDGAEAAIYNSVGDIALVPSGDNSDYFLFQTNSDVPTITTGGASNLKISPSSGVIDLDGCAIIGMGGLATEDNYVLDDGVGDSPYIQFVDGDDNTLTMYKTDSGAGVFLNNEGTLNFYPNNDNDDYFVMETNTNEVILRAAGATSMNYGDATVTDHTFLSDSTGDAEVVLPNDSIGDAEIDWSGLTTDADFTVTGTLFTSVGIDAVGAVDLDYGSADVTDHTFITDGTGDGEIVLPNDSIGDDEIDWSGLTADAAITTDGLTITTGNSLILGTTQWDNGSDHIDGEIIADDTIDDDSIDFADVTGADLTLTDCGNITSTGVVDLSGATTFELPNSADPDITDPGMLSADTDDYTLRGSDGVNQFSYAQGVGPRIAFTVLDPLYLTDASTSCVWVNTTGMTLHITEIHSKSDTDDTVYTLDETNGNDYTDLTEIQAVTIATNGTGVYYDDTTGLNVTIENGNSIVFDNDAADNPAWINVVIVGWYDANVN